MILGIDAGNTNIVAALINENGVIKKCRYNTAKQESASYHKHNLEKLIISESVSAVIISSVVPEINDYLNQACFDITGMIPVFAGSELKTGLAIKYDNPQKLGADLICAAVGAVSRYGSPAIVVDIGTATTFSVINENNEYLGGMISPGPLTSMKALASMASQLPEIKLEATDKIIGTNTQDCIKIGILTAHSAMIDAMLDKVKNQLNRSDIRLVATGGFAKTVTAMCTHKIICDDNLIFKGLYELYKMNLN